MAQKTINIIGIFPRNTMAQIVNLNAEQPEYSTVECITPSEKKKIRIVYPINDFTTENCLKCTKYMKQERIKEIYDQIRKKEIPYNNVEQYIQATKACKGTVMYNPGETCFSGYTLEEYKHIEVDSHYQLWRQVGANTKTSIELFAVDYEAYKNDDLKLKVYKLANVYDGGRVCWGKHNQVPKTLREAYKTYWESDFNSDLTGVYKRTLAETLQLYNPNEDGTWKNWKDTHHTSSYTSRNKVINVRDNQYDGVLITNSSKVTELVPKQYLFNDFAIAWVKELYADNYLLVIGNLVYSKSGKLRGTSKIKLLGEKGKFNL